MKTRLTLPLLLLSLLALSACTTLWTSVVTITKVDDTVMKAYGDLYAAGKSTPAIDAAVDKAQARFQQAASVTAKALRAYKDSGNPDDYQTALAEAKAAAQEVLDIITPLLLAPKAQEFQAQLDKAKTL